MSWQSLLTIEAIWGHHIVTKHVTPILKIFFTILTVSANKCQNSLSKDFLSSSLPVAIIVLLAIIWLLCLDICQISSMIWVRLVGVGRVCIWLYRKRSQRLFVVLMTKFWLVMISSLLLFLFVVVRMNTENIIKLETSCLDEYWKYYKVRNLNNSIN